MTDTPTRADLIERLRSVDVSWSEVGEWCAEAVAALTSDAERIAELERALEAERVSSAMMVEQIAALEGLLSMVMEASEYDERKQRHVGWNITRLNKARPLLQSALAGTNPSEIARIAALEGEVERLRGEIVKAIDAPLIDHFGGKRGIYDVLRAALKGTDND